MEIFNSVLNVVDVSIIISDCNVSRVFDSSSCCRNIICNVVNVRV